MHNSTDLWLFFVMVFGVIVLPGMDMAFVASSAMTRGLRGGFTAVAGIVFAGMLHTVVGATLLLLWPAAYNALLIAGAFYMVWIGASILRSADAVAAASAPTAASVAPVGTIFRRALLTCLLNPKAYVFMLAVFPAFMRSTAYTLPVQAARLGGVIALTQGLVYGAVAVFVAQARQGVGASPQGQRWIARAVGIALIAGAMLTVVFAWQTGPGTPGSFTPSQA